MAEAENSAGDEGLKEYDVMTNGISLHLTEQGEGPAVVFCHGFPDTSYTWRRQMKAIASAGYRAIAPDMRGYGRSSAPADATLYTPLQTAGDLVGLLFLPERALRSARGYQHLRENAQGGPSKRFLHVRTNPTRRRSNLGRRHGHHSGYSVLGIRFCSGRQAVEPDGSCTKPSSSGSRAITLLGGARLRPSQHRGIPAHRLSRWPELLPRRRIVFRLVRRF